MTNPLEDIRRNIERIKSQVGIDYFEPLVIFPQGRADMSQVLFQKNEWKITRDDDGKISVQQFRDGGTVARCTESTLGLCGQVANVPWWLIDKVRAFLSARMIEVHVGFGERFFTDLTLECPNELDFQRTARERIENLVPGRKVAVYFGIRPDVEDDQFMVGFDEDEELKSAVYDTIEGMILVDN